MSDGEPIPTVESVRATFDATIPHTVGLEEEVLLVDPVTWLPAPEADAVARLANDPGIKTELPACQVETSLGSSPRTPTHGDSPTPPDASTSDATPPPSTSVPAAAWWQSLPPSEPAR